jgi:hypothetical protein
LSFINQDDNFIIYYSGHGAAPGPNGDALIPGYDANGKAEYVSPADIHTNNARLVFLNSCNSMHDRSFEFAFGLNNEIVLGWDKSINYMESSEFGYQWWDNMYNGFTAIESADAVLFTIFTDRALLPDLPKIVITNYNFKL